MTLSFRTLARSTLPVVAAIVALAVTPVATAQVGKVKVATGTVTIERAGATLPARVGTPVMAADVVCTGPQSSVGILMSDDSMLSAGATSALRIDRYEYDATTNRGRFDSSLSRGTLSVVSGRIAKESPEAMTVRTPLAILGVRGTEFLVSADDGGATREP